MMHAERPGDGGYRHVHPVRIYYEDTDSSGLVYHSNYLRFAERARTEMLREFGFVHPELLERHGIAFVVRHLEADFRAPARLDDLVRVETRVARQRGASLDLEQTIVADGADLVRIRMTLACIDRSGRPRRVPAEVHRTLARLVTGQAGRADGK